MGLFTAWRRKKGKFFSDRELRRIDSDEILSFPRRNDIAMHRIAFFPGFRLHFRASVETMATVEADLAQTRTVLAGPGRTYG